ncbi:ATP-binding protein, partial [Bifidobacterium boum]|uniref:ATP-binding protein n=1 Tax=Bifidobacterium boum TaxID=78343 RepID=UPI003F93113D
MRRRHPRAARLPRRPVRGWRTPAGPNPNAPACPGRAGFPQSKTLDGYDWSMASFPADWGREQLASLQFVDKAEDLVLYGDVGCGKTHLAIAIGELACRRMIPVRFFTA